MERLGNRRSRGTINDVLVLILAVTQNSHVFHFNFQMHYVNVLQKRSAFSSPNYAPVITAFFVVPLLYSRCCVLVFEANFVHNYAHILLETLVFFFVIVLPLFLIFFFYLGNFLVNTMTIIIINIAFFIFFRSRLTNMV